MNTSELFSVWSSCLRKHVFNLCNHCWALQIKTKYSSSQRLNRKCVLFDYICSRLLRAH